MIEPQHREQLLQLARQTVEAHVLGSLPPLPLDTSRPPFSEQYGMFVTLHVDGQLRGCMGTFTPDKPVGRLTQDITMTSLNDPRFVYNRIRPQELGRLNIEISLLSPMQRVADPLAEFKAGVHGIYVRVGNRGGCFLPQVATEMGWNGQQMLDQCCAHKAGLPAEAWRRPDAEVYFFTATVFHEPQQGSAPT